MGTIYKLSTQEARNQAFKTELIDLFSAAHSFDEIEETIHELRKGVVADE